MHVTEFPLRDWSVDVPGTPTQRSCRRHCVVSTSKRSAVCSLSGFRYAAVLSTFKRSVLSTSRLSVVVSCSRHPVPATRRSCQRRGVESYARHRVSAMRLSWRRHCVVSFACYSTVALWKPNGIQSTLQHVR